MASHLTDDEVATNYVTAMGSELGKVFHQFWRECAWLHWEWNECVILFGTSRERVDLLIAAAPGFAPLLDASLWDTVLLHISRLTDNPQVASKDTLTLKRLPQLVDPGIRPRVQDLLDDVVKKAGFARDWRNRRIAHRDLGWPFKKTLSLSNPQVETPSKRRWTRSSSY
jgi:AbiU2